MNSYEPGRVQFDGIHAAAGSAEPRYNLLAITAASPVRAVMRLATAAISSGMDRRLLVFRQDVLWSSHLSLRAQ